MKCLESYRAALVRAANRELRTLLVSPDPSAVHDFRVCMKRINALYRFLNEIDASIEARQLLKPHRRLFKRIGAIRDAQIAIQLIEENGEIPPRDCAPLISALRARIRRNYGRFKEQAAAGARLSIRLPTIRATRISQSAILAHRPIALEGLLREATAIGDRMGAEHWHGKRILLKRYHHLVDAFSNCPGQVKNARIMKQVTILEQLLGDWHDRVVVADILASLPGPGANREKLIAAMKRQSQALLGSSRLYLRKLATRL